MELLRGAFVLAGLVWVAGWGVRCWVRAVIAAAEDLPPLDADQLAARGLYLVDRGPDA